jgi:glycine cleavage system H protein
MSNLPEDVKYTKEHEWVRLEDGGVAVIGITDHAQELLGDLVFVELPEVGAVVTAGSDDGIAVVESVKAASDVYSPVAGEVVAINAALVDTPEIINEDPYQAGWLFKVKLAEEPVGLLDVAAYAAFLETEEH